MKAVILAAGIGSRLQMGIPKALVKIKEQSTILDIQLRALESFVKPQDIFVVVGHMKEEIINRYPQLSFVFNDKYSSTNTCKSLLLGLRRTEGIDTIWLNGDVYLDSEVVRRVASFGGSCAAVNNARVADEEVKYVLSEHGTIAKISKEVKDALGEAVGVNKVLAKDLPLLVAGLEQCQDNDYFERGMELSVKDVDYHAVDISDLPCIEIDFMADLERARVLASRSQTHI